MKKLFVYHFTLWHLCLSIQLHCPAVELYNNFNKHIGLWTKGWNACWPLQGTVNKSTALTIEKRQNKRTHGRLDTKPLLYAIRFLTKKTISCFFQGLAHSNESGTSKICPRKSHKNSFATNWEILLTNNTIKRTHNMTNSKFRASHNAYLSEKCSIMPY